MPGHSEMMQPKHLQRQSSAFSSSKKGNNAKNGEKYDAFNIIDFTNNSDMIDEREFGEAGF